MNAVVFDIETTGLSYARGHRILEIGALRITEGQIVDEFNSLIDLSKPF
ncbi:MAG: hypothetical protein C0618_04385 [Desulfuromonas sp.]|nr:MAG: hypothetical protein C0618_04385 [Desulfuromonas sp.]